MLVQTPEDNIKYTDELAVGDIFEYYNDFFMVTSTPKEVREDKDRVPFLLCVVRLSDGVFQTHTNTVQVKVRQAILQVIK